MHGIAPHQVCVSVLPAIHKALQEPGKKPTIRRKPYAISAASQFVLGCALKSKKLTGLDLNGLCWIFAYVTGFEDWAVLVSTVL